MQNRLRVLPRGNTLFSCYNSFMPNSGSKKEYEALRLQWAALQDYL